LDFAVQERMGKYFVENKLPKPVELSLVRDNSTGFAL
jgi:hypothetical protein